MLTVRLIEGTQISYDPGEMEEVPTWMPDHAWDSMRVLEIIESGFTAHAAQPKGMMCMILGLSPVRLS